MVESSINKKSNFSQQGISVITCTNRPLFMERLFANYSSQNYNNKELIIILNNNNMDKKKYQKKANYDKHIKIFQLDENVDYASCKKFAFNHANCNYIAFFDDDDYYGPNYLSHSISTFNTIDCDIVGKRTFFVYFENLKTLALCSKNHENRYVDHVADSSMIFKRQLLEKLEFPNDPYPDTEFQRKCYNYGFKIYSTNKSNYVYHRHSSINKHVWKISNDDFLKQCEVVKKDINDYINYVLK